VPRDRQDHRQPGPGRDGRSHAVVHFTVDGAAIASHRHGPTQAAPGHSRRAAWPTAPIPSWPARPMRLAPARARSASRSIRMPGAGVHRRHPGQRTGELDRQPPRSRRYRLDLRGNSWLGFATSGSNGSFNFTAAADSSITHSYGMNATDLAGNEGHSSSPLVLSSSTVTPPVSVPVLTEKLVSDSGASATDKITRQPGSDRDGRSQCSRALHGRRQGIAANRHGQRKRRLVVHADRPDRWPAHHRGQRDQCRGRYRYGLAVLHARHACNRSRCSPVESRPTDR